MEIIKGSPDEWRTAGKSKSTKSTKPASQPTPTGNRNGETVTNGHTNGSAVIENGSGHSTQHNGISNGSRRGGRQNGHQNRPKPNSTYVNSQPSKSASTKEDAMSKRKIIEKEAKNLAKHDVASERIERLFKEEVEKSHDRIRRAFDEMRKHLNEREKGMLIELENCKSEGLQLLEQGKGRAKQLHIDTERAPSMNDRQINDLRDQIKRFLSERRIEEDLGRTIRFQFEPDRLIDMIKTFGEVIPVGKDPQKHVSQTSLVSSLDDDTSNSGICNAKPVSEISSGGICMKSDSMTAEQLAQLTLHLKETLKLQGITEDILPDVSGVAGAMPAPRRRPPPARADHYNGHGGNQNHQNGRGGGRPRGGQRNGHAQY
jgi:hypothetical protein